MSLLDVTKEIVNQSVILSRSITKLDDVYSFIDLVDEKLSLDINLTLILLGSDHGNDAKIEDNTDLKTEVFDTDKENVGAEQMAVPKSDDEDDDDDPSFHPDKEEQSTDTDSRTAANNTEEIVKVIKFKKKPDEIKRLCDECGKSFANKRHLKRHILASHLKVKKSYTCPICKLEGEYLYYGSFFKHKQACEAKLPENAERYTCSICEAKFGTYYDWKNHYYVCSGNKPKRSYSKPTKYNCDKCDYVTKVKSKLKNHIHVVHLNLPEIRDQTCDTCGKAFKDKKTLKTHVHNVHLEIRAHQCTDCGSSFKSRDLLRRHMKIHSDICTEICIFCGKGFKQSATLYRHKLSCPSNPKNRVQN